MNKTTFGELRPGDVFVAAGFRDTGETARFRKFYSDRAMAVQDGRWERFPPEWPVELEDSVVEPVPGFSEVHP